MLPTSWRVTHAYLEGRLSIYKNELQSARDQLRRALAFCHIEYTSNQRKILKFLVPVEMNLNRFPTSKLLQRHNLLEYLDISNACQSGDILGFEKALSFQMDNFVYGGVYLVFERLRNLTLRNLLKRIALVVRREPELQVAGGAHILQIELIYNILREWDPQLDMDEVECIIANLIHQGLVKGYISHERRLLVLASKGGEPFPLQA